MSAICIDGHNLALPRGSGIATYGRNLLSAIRTSGREAQILHGPLIDPGDDPLLREVTVSDARLGVRAALPQPSRHVQVALARFGRKAWPVAPSGKVRWPDTGNVPPADFFWLSENLYRIASRAFSNSRILTPVRFMEASTPDVMHWTYPSALKAVGAPNVYTFHDLIPLTLPHTTLDDKRRYLDLCRSIVRTADHLVAVSETTRQDVIRTLGVEPSRITTTWQSADLPPGTLDRSVSTVADAISDTFGLDWKGYFVFFGAIEPKKNLARLVEAYLKSQVKTPLVVVGGKAWLDEGETGFLDEIIKSDAAASRRLHRYDYLPRSVLLDLVRGARATLFPSLYEGFGLPVLEAMMLDTAVMASGEGSLPEIAQGAAEIVDAYDVDDMSRAIRRLDASHDRIDELVELGRKRAAFFSPHRYQERVASMYRELGA